MTEEQKEGEQEIDAANDTSLTEGFRERGQARKAGSKSWSSLEVAEMLSIVKSFRPTGKDTWKRVANILQSRAR
jgi:hypothetical protein